MRLGVLQKQNDLEAPSDEDEDAFETVRAIDKLRVPLDANARDPNVDLKGDVTQNQAALGDLDHQGTPSLARVRLAELCANHDMIDLMNARSEAESASDNRNFSNNEYFTPN